MNMNMNVNQPDFDAGSALYCMQDGILDMINLG
jgi:hypothetical protein